MLGHLAVVPRSPRPIPRRGRHARLLLLLGLHRKGRNRAVRPPHLAADVAAAFVLGFHLCGLGYTNISGVQG